MRFQHLCGRFTLRTSAAAAALIILSAVYLYAQMYRTSSSPHVVAPAVYPMYDTLLAFGDSITQFGSNPRINGFVGELASYYSRRMDVLNRGISGYNTRQALAVVDQVFPKTVLPRKHITSKILEPLGRWPHRDDTFPGTAKGPRLCLIFFGANDASLPFARQHIPLDEFSDNLRQMVTSLHDPSSVYYSPDTHILLITPPPVGDRMWEKDCKKHKIRVDRKNAVTKTYADAVKMVAKESGLPYVDLWTAIEFMVHNNRTDSAPTSSSTQDNEYKTADSKETAKSNGTATDSPEDGYKEYLSDGLHLNAKGNKLLFYLIVGKIRSNWPYLNP
ncbi:isoamyl acetate-hydrolyzing esterase [Coemansia guatemalensis]|uniref:Isoamyl acetate-hydrolyzing esterase n=1 Tax=Coemansia guatemalensis TaxID=2761395 RepID=A0A9W8HXC9_9FUNG|nr:isoamyl acetate-hydrolyzing esterase [Coemansia guatemalensis]